MEKERLRNLREKDIKDVAAITGLSVYLTERDVAKLTQLALSTLRNFRHQGRGPAFFRSGGRSVRYKLADVVFFMERRRVIPQDQG